MVAVDLWVCVCYSRSDVYFLSCVLLPALQIGPDSGNLSGGRRAAELIGDDLRERLEAEWDEEDAGAESDSLSLAGAGNMYALLACAS